MTPTPKYARIPAACAMYGVGRTRLYDLIGRGAIRAVKSGSATLIDLESVEAWAVSLPQAEIAPQRRREAA